MAIVQTQCDIFKLNLLKGLEDFDVASATVYKIALYTANASIDATTTNYTTTNEISGTGYTAGGVILTKIAPAYTGSTAYVSFGTAVWNPANFTARGALIYNSTTGFAVAVLDFGADKTASNGTFTITFPTADANNAILRIS